MGQLRQHICDRDDRRYEPIGRVKPPLFEALRPLVPIAKETRCDGANSSAEEGNDDEAKEPRIIHNSEHGSKVRRFWTHSLRSSVRVAGFRFRLHDAEGDELGEFNTAVPNWSVGDTFTTGDRRKFRILKMAPIEDVDDAVF